jgi:iron complex transport system substrate-binding protein
MALWPLRKGNGRQGLLVLTGLALLTLIGGGALASRPAPAPLPPAKVTRAVPQRIVSLDYCADQFVLKFADGNQILALSSQSQAEYSYLRAKAKGLPQIRSRAEEVLALSPDLVVRTYGGGPDAARFFQQAGTPVLQLAGADDFTAIRANLKSAAATLGHPERGEAAARQFDATLASASRKGPAVQTLYLTPGGVQAGAGTSLGQMMTTAGLEPYDKSRPGWSELPLEKLAVAPPRLVVTGFMNFGTLELFPWSAARHPLIKNSLKTRPTLALPGAVTACPGWFIADATLAMARAGDPLRGQR